MQQYVAFKKKEEEEDQEKETWLSILGHDSTHST